MTRILLSGAGGRLGSHIAEAARQRTAFEIVAGIDPSPAAKADFPLCAQPSEFEGEADVLVDCSHPSALEKILEYAIPRRLPLVLCTTGYSDEQLARVSDAAKVLPIFRSANMSLGIALLSAIAAEVAGILGDSYDVEIVERHHRRKLDAPSGTALMLADSVRRALEHPVEYVYDRHDRRRERPRDEIGISAVRGGTIVGDHEIIFAGTDELIELRHSAQSRAVFAEGALRAAAFTASRTEPGMYSMDDLMKEYLGK